MDENYKVETEQTPVAGKPKKKKKSWKQELREWIVALAVALIVVFVIQTFLFRIIRVDGQSMETTLHNGERLFVNVAELRFTGRIDRGSIVICNYPNRYTSVLGIKFNTYFVKRLVGVPGDTVYRKDGVTHIVYTDESGQQVDDALDENWSINYAMLYPDLEPYTLGEDEYFVVGDNRYNSHDSRDWKGVGDNSNEVGPISKSMIVGKVQHIIWPLNSIRPAE